MTTKSQTEFVGDYSAFFGIYSLLSAPPAVGGGGAAAAVADKKADDAPPPPPRAKYVVARRIEELKNKGRTESF